MKLPFIYRKTDSLGLELSIPMLCLCSRIQYSLFTRDPHLSLLFVCILNSGKSEGNLIPISQFHYTNPVPLCSSAIPTQPGKDLVLCVQLELMNSTSSSSLLP